MAKLPEITTKFGQIVNKQSSVGVDWNFIKSAPFHAKPHKEQAEIIKRTALVRPFTQLLNCDKTWRDTRRNGAQQRPRYMWYYQERMNWNNINLCSFYLQSRQIWRNWSSKERINKCAFINLKVFVELWMVGSRSTMLMLLIFCASLILFLFKMST